MQMSLEAITMLMRFHHRSCCSGIRSIFHPYLENSCVLKIGDTLQCSWWSQQVSTSSVVHNKLECGQSQTAEGVTYLVLLSRIQWCICSVNIVFHCEILLYFQHFFSYIICLSIISELLLLITQSNSSSQLQNITNILHVGICSTQKRKKANECDCLHQQHTHQTQLQLYVFTLRCETG